MCVQELEKELMVKKTDLHEISSTNRHRNHHGQPNPDPAIGEDRGALPGRRLIIPGGLGAVRSCRLVWPRRIEADLPADPSVPGIPPVDRGCKRRRRGGGDGAGGGGGGGEGGAGRRALRPSLAEEGLGGPGGGGEDGRPPTV